MYLGERESSDDRSTAEQSTGLLGIGARSLSLAGDEVSAGKTASASETEPISIESTQKIVKG